MKKFLLLLCIFLSSVKGYAQYDNMYDAAYADFTNLMNTFLQLPTIPSRNSQIYAGLEELKEIINRANVVGKERYQINSLIEDIDVVKEFIAPISSKYNASLTDAKFKRLQDVFGAKLVKRKLNVICPNDEVEFVEVNLENLRICYLHCISLKVENGLRVKFHAKSGNTVSDGEYGVAKNRYTPVSHNAGNKYMRINAARIIKRF